MIEQGASFDGYRVERMLGRGGMGVVYEAVQDSLDRRVALKVLRPELADDPAFVARFRREGRLQASLEHPNVLDVYEVGESPNGLFLAMRLVDGPTLAELLRSGELDAARALHLLEQVADALDAAHAAGLVHRDVKPQNVLVGEGDTAFLADFGLTRPGTETVTASRPMLGTVAYAAPEVVRGEAPGPASDRYAFAATLFHCLAGEVVFPRGSDAAALHAQASEPPPRISERRPALPPALDRVFEGALAKDPARRPPTAHAMVAAVRDALGPRAVAELPAPDPRPRPAPAPAVAPVPSTSPDRPRRRVAVLVAVALVAALAGAGLVALLQSGDDAAVDEVRVPQAPAGALVLGSDLGLPHRSVGCDGKAPAAGTAPCSVAQADLPGAQLLVPEDGLIVGWAVRGARGEIALDVLRPGGKDTTRIGRSQWESAGNAAAHRFTASIPVERGDRIGIELGRGAAIGVRDADGATTQRWLAPTGGAYGSADRGPGTGLDHEVLLRAFLVPGAGPVDPRQLTGGEAASAPDGRTRTRAPLTISRPAARMTVALVEVGDRVAVDLFRGERRVARMALPGLLPGGVPIDLATYTYDGEAVSEVDVYWVNPNSGRMVFHFLNASRSGFDFIG